jgi:hypothetical protein
MLIYHPDHPDVHVDVDGTAWVTIYAPLGYLAVESDVTAPPDSEQETAPAKKAAPRKRV